MTNKPLLPETSPGADASGKIDANLVRRLTCFDGLTGLPNRLLFREQLGLVLRLAERRKSTGVVLLADIDDFRRIKNSLGHRQSDVFIKTMAARIRACLRDSDVFADVAPSDRSLELSRISGSEFAVILNGLTQPHDAQRVAQRIREAVAAVILIGGGEVFATLSIGAALFPDDGVDPDILMEHAEVALGQAKDKGKDRVQFYDPKMDTLAADRLALESSLRRAVEDEEFFAVYQPRVDCRTGQIHGMEALVRWRHPSRGVVAPGAFIEVAEQCRVIVPIGEFMLNEACRMNRHWQDMGFPSVAVSVNVSAVQVAQGDFVNSVARALERNHLDPQWLELEITESLLMIDTEGAKKTFMGIKALGVKVAIDDFGTGFSSMAYLRDFPFDVIKIDKSFVSSVLTDSRTAALTCAIIDLARRLGLDVVAEGVETDAERAYVDSNGCHLIQGYFFSRPVEPDGFEQFWRSRLALPGASHTMSPRPV